MATETESPLELVLSGLRVEGHLLLHGLHRPPWAARVPEGDKVRDAMGLGGGWEILPFHIVLAGEVNLRPEGDETIHLRAGDMVICPGGQSHLLWQGGYSEIHRFEDVLAAADGSCRIGFETGGDRCTEMICGAFALRGEPLNPLLMALPSILLLHAGERPTSMLPQVIGLLSHELARASQNRFATARLIEIIFAEALRLFASLQSATGVSPGWFHALADPRISQALSAVHAEPSLPWTVNLLADKVALSPSRFSARFREVTGQSVMSYVADRRMHLACQLLRDSLQALAPIAAAVGYHDTAAFSRAFKARLGMSPAHWRGAARGAGPGRT